MASPENKRKELEHILKKENFVRIAEAIRMLRNESPFEGAAGLLISFYDKTDNTNVKNLIKEFFNDLKDQASCSEIISWLRTDIRPETKHMLVSSCWQSGLNYTAYSADFAKIFVEQDYMTALECFTVIESSADSMTRSKKDEVISIINEGINVKSGYKNDLAVELISILK